MLRCFIVRIWMRIPSNNALHSFFLLSTENPYNARVMMACGLHMIPDRRTFDRRLKNISADGSDEDLRPRIDAMGRLFVAEELIDPYITSVDSTLLKAKGHVWHRSSMEKGFVYSGTDTDARWGKSRTKGWVFGYKLHIVSSTGSLIVPISADFTTANIPDSKAYGRVTASLRGVRYVDGDQGYDVDDLYELSRERGFDLVCPIGRYENTHPERIELVFFYESDLGQLVYSWRSKSVEPLFEQIKDVFGIDPLPVRGFDKTKMSVLLSVLLYQVMVYYNHLTARPLRTLKHMLGS
jgi:Transposase DDE domain